MKRFAIRILKNIIKLLTTVPNYAKKAYFVYDRALLRSVVTGLNSYCGYFVSLEKLEAKTTHGVVEVPVHEFFESIQDVNYFMYDNYCTTSGVLIGTESTEKVPLTIMESVNRKAAIDGIEPYSEAVIMNAQRKQLAKGLKKYGCDLENSGLNKLQVRAHLLEELVDSFHYSSEIKRK